MSSWQIRTQIDAKVADETAAAARYAKALNVWERVVRDIARRIGSKKKKA